jgi:hypothetical protein
MLIYVTGVAGTGKSTLRVAPERRGYRAQDADESLCAWLDANGNEVPALPLELRTPEWYSSHSFALIPKRVEALENACIDGLGFVLGLASNGACQAR